MKHSFIQESVEPAYIHGYKTFCNIKRPTITTKIRGYKMMEQSETKKAIEQILDESDVGVMSTVCQNKPYSRYMTFGREGLTLYTATSKDTHKVDDIEANPNTHIILGYEGDGYGDEYVEYEGKVALKDSEKLKKKLWNSYMDNWFSGLDDPNYIIMEISPTQIKRMNKKGKEPEVLTFQQ